MCALGGYGLTEGNSGENRRGLRGWLSLGRWGVSRRGRKGPHGRGERMWMGIYTPPTHPESLPLDSVPRESRAVTGHAPGSRGKPRAIAPCSPCFAQTEISWSFVRHYLPSSPLASARYNARLASREPKYPGASCVTTRHPRLWLRFAPLCVRHYYALIVHPSQAGCVLQLILRAMVYL